MGLSPSEQERLYTEYWNNIEKDFEYAEHPEYLFGRFIKDYLTIKLRRIPKIKDIYKEFKLYPKNKDVETLLIDFNKFSLLRYIFYICRKFW